MGKNIKYTKQRYQVKFEFKIHVGEDLVKLEKSAKNIEVVGILNHAEVLREKIKFFLEKQEFFLMKNEILFRVIKIIN